MKRLILKLKPIEGKAFDIDEIEILPLGNLAEITAVQPDLLGRGYKNLDLWLETCRVGESPVLGYALGIYDLKLPCIVEEVVMGDEYPDCCKTCKQLYTIINIPGKTKYICKLNNKQTKLEKTCNEWGVNPRFINVNDF